MANTKDNLHKNHSIFQKKMDEFVEVRPALKYLSIRVKRMELLSNENFHVSALNNSIANISQKSKIAKKPGTGFILEHVRTKMLNHGESFRANEVSFKNEHIWENIKAKADIWPSSGHYKRLWGKQKNLISMVGSDIEAQCVIRFIDHQLVRGGIIAQDDVLNDDHELLRLAKDTEDTVQSLRMLMES